MKKITLFNIIHSQEDYLALLLHFKDQVNTDGLTVTQICSLLDEVKCFWLKRLKPIEIELEELSQNNNCFILSGAIYLGVCEYEHYYFKSLGDYHIIPDPFSKFEDIFRHPKERINVSNMVEYFKKAFLDILDILSHYNSHFFILPTQEIAIDDPDKRSELLNSFFWNFISSAFNEEIRSNEEFKKRYKDLNEIEAGLDKSVCKNLIFNDLYDYQLSLKEKVGRFSMNFKNVSTENPFKSEREIFLTAIYSYVAQVADILIISSVLGLNPYIRFEITFSYFSMLMSIFTDDEYLKKIIEKTLIFYVFYKTIEQDYFKNISFSDYCKKLNGKSLLNSIIEKIHADKIEITSNISPKVEVIIREEFESIF